MKYEVKETGRMGKGAFAMENIKKGEFIEEFTGEIMNRAETHRRIEAGLVNADDPFQFDDDSFLDIDNSARYFNHSCEPNAGIKSKFEIIAINNISKGEEITFDYSTTVGKDIDNWTMKCDCGAQNCRHVIGNVTTIPKDQLIKYYEAGTLQDYIRKQLDLK